jgi:hypothetical protein
VNYGSRLKARPCQASPPALKSLRLSVAIAPNNRNAATSFIPDMSWSKCSRSSWQSSAPWGLSILECGVDFAVAEERMAVQVARSNRCPLSIADHEFGVNPDGLALSVVTQSGDPGQREILERSQSRQFRWICSRRRHHRDNFDAPPQRLPQTLDDFRLFDMLLLDIDGTVRGIDSCTILIEVAIVLPLLISMGAPSGVVRPSRYLPLWIVRCICTTASPRGFGNLVGNGRSLSLPAPQRPSAE